MGGDDERGLVANQLVSPWQHGQLAPRRQGDFGLIQKDVNALAAEALHEHYQDRFAVGFFMQRLSTAGIDDGRPKGRRTSSFCQI